MCTGTHGVLGFNLDVGYIGVTGGLLTDQVVTRLYEQTVMRVANASRRLFVSVLALTVTVLFPK